MPVWTGTQFVIESGGQSIHQFTASQPASDQYLLKANNLSDVPNRNIARQNLGITVSVTPPVSPQINDLWVDLDIDLGS